MVVLAVSAGGGLKPCLGRWAPWLLGIMVGVGDGV